MHSLGRDWKRESCILYGTDDVILGKVRHPSRGHPLSTALRGEKSGCAVYVFAEDSLREVRSQDAEHFPCWMRCEGHVNVVCHGADVSELLRREMHHYARERGNAAMLSLYLVYRL